MRRCLASTSGRPARSASIRETDVRGAYPSGETRAAQSAIQNPKSKIQNRMTVKVLIPTALQKFTNDLATIDCEGNSIAELLDALEAQSPGVKARLCDESGQLRRFLNLYVNDEDIRFLSGTETPLKDGDQVSIVPAVAGG